MQKCKHIRGHKMKTNFLLCNVFNIIYFPTTHVPIEGNFQLLFYSHVQGVSKVRGHFKKSILHPDFFIFPSIFLQT